MVRKHKEQFDSGGILFDHTFLLTFDELNSIINEESVDILVENHIEDFKFNFKLTFMVKMGYGMDNEGNWVKISENG